MSIDDIRNRDDLIFNVFKDNHRIVEEYLRITKFPATATALLMLNTSSNFIKNSIFDVCETRDIYSGKILFRSLIDHFLRFYFLFLSWLTEKNDQVGQDYLSICDAKDVIDMMKAYKFVGTLQGIQPPNESDNEILQQFPNPIFQKYSKKEIEQLSRQYTYKYIIKKIRELLNKGGDKNVDPALLKSLIVEYAELSSFVHGGKMAIQYLTEVQEKSSLEPEMIKLCEMAFTIGASIKMFSYLMFLQEDNRLSAPYKELYRLIKL